MSTLARSWLTIAQAAAATGRSERTIQRWTSAGRLPTLDVGGARYVNELQLLHVERATRTAARHGRPGARPGAALRSGVVSSRHSGLRPAPDGP